MDWIKPSMIFISGDKYQKQTEKSKYKYEDN